MKEKSKEFTLREDLLRGFRDGIPIALGYMAVAFSLGIVMKKVGMSAAQGFLFSFLNLASAGEYAALQVIAADSAYLEIAIVTLVANARYLLMSTALSQKFSERTSIIHRFFVGYGVTDELFALGIGQSPYLSPWYYYGALGISSLFWALGSAGGIIAGNILPARIVRALSVSLFGMFLAIIIPPAKKDKAVAAVVCSGFLLSFLCEKLPFLHLSGGTKTIVLTILIASIASLVHPHIEKEADHEA
jgi:4-azaleucine resistance transporter AzlC